MVRVILIGIAVILAGFLVVVALQPSNFRITRSATFFAPISKVFANVNDLQAFQAWSPWAKLDPNAKAVFEGPRVGEGAIFRWNGNDQVGAGSMTITESRPNELIKFKLEFLKPFAATSTTEFIFKNQGDQTEVTWTMSGQNNFIGKAMGLMMNCDKMVGGQFEQGLANLKVIVEK